MRRQSFSVARPAAAGRAYMNGPLLTHQWPTKTIAAPRVCRSACPLLANADIQPRSTSVAKPNRSSSGGCMLSRPSTTLRLITSAPDRQMRPTYQRQERHYESQSRDAWAPFRDLHRASARHLQLRFSHLTQQSRDRGRHPCRSDQGPQATAAGVKTAPNIFTSQPTMAEIGFNRLQIAGVTCNMIGFHYAALRWSRVRQKNRR